MSDRERAVQPDLEQADLFAARREVINGLHRGVADRAHGDDQLVRVGRAIVIEQLVVGADLGVDAVHIVFHDRGHGVVVFVGGFARLEEDVGVLRGAAQDRVLGI